jgi:hypothetical protein
VVSAPAFAAVPDQLIEELTVLSLRNPTDRFQLEVSVRVLRPTEAHVDGGNPTM